MHHDDLTAAWLTIRLALVTTAVLLLVGIPLAWWLARAQSRLRLIVETIVTLPLVLPPTVLGFYVLLLLGERGPVGAMSGFIGIETLAFSFTGLVIGSFVYSLPFVVRPIQMAFAQVDRRLLDVAATLGCGPWDRLRSVIFPLARPGVLVAAVLGFAHTIGEFGVVLMIGGNIPGRTRVLSIAIYDHVEAGAYGRAHVLAAALLGASFVLLLLVHLVYRRARRMG